MDNQTRLKELQKRLAHKHPNWSADKLRWVIENAMRTEARYEQDC